MSQRKRLLFLLELLAAVLGATGLGIFALALVGVAVPAETDISFIAAFALMFVLIMSALMLSSEYVHRARGGNKFEAEKEGFSSDEIAALCAWAPVSYNIAAGLGLLVGLSAMLLAGPISLTGTGALTRPESYGLGGFLASALLALPVFGSAARMPGAYSDNFAVNIQKRV